MGASSGANFNHQPPPKMLPPRQHPRPGLLASQSLASSDAAEPLSFFNQGHDSPSDSTGSGETWPIETDHSNSYDAKKLDKEKEGESEYPEPLVNCRVLPINKLSLREVVRERVDVIADRMMFMPIELLEDLKTELRMILKGTGGTQNSEEFLNLQRMLYSRTDLTEKTLVKAHRVLVEIFVAINTGIQGFLHPNHGLPQTRLAEVFLYKRCRNISCQIPLPANECSCQICVNTNGFCNQCMCGICNKFDFEINTCRWIGCDACVHWTHTDCAMHAGRIGMGQSVKGGAGHPEMLFRCQACNKTSELLGWVRDVFQHCANEWDREALLRELELVNGIFRMSEDSRGRKLYRKSSDLIKMMKSDATPSTMCKLLMLLFQELEIDSTKNLTETEDPTPLIAPQEAYNQIAEVVKEVMRKMEVVAEEKSRDCSKARLAMEACDSELDKARQVAELKRERQRKKQQVEELESIARLKQAEADMFQLKASEARQEAERLQTTVLAKSKKAAAEQDYASMYLKRRLEEAEAEKQYLFKKIKLQESQVTPQAGSSSGGGGDETMIRKIQDILKNVYNSSPKSDIQQRSK